MSEFRFGYRMTIEEFAKGCFAAGLRAVEIRAASKHPQAGPPMPPLWFVFRERLYGTEQYDEHVGTFAPMVGILWTNFKPKQNDPRIWFSGRP